ncbi:hypothetical protein [Halorubrum lipolyticum]|uniref:DUF624 domain-containing protein n=1 Tax=Halorubrum lipolyticum DSM 21995 TaxID=1227482 RepID=M0NQV0_9EURY|nr:hypothetical protein [Halorubrum lipolyticum]EMA59584.1 hypothetical protein C469_09681 [Halorubrum lipolyticum DSM 21995]
MSTHDSAGETGLGDRPTHKRTLRFVYRHGAALIAVSVAWFLASLPLVTIGPATLGAYAAVRSLRQTGRLDRGYVVSAVRTNGVHALLLSVLPVVFAAPAALSLRGGSTFTGPTPIVAVVGLYVAGYLAVALIPTFVAMADGESPVAALKRAYVWTATDPAAALSLALVTAIVFAVTALLTIGFVLLFAAAAFSYHVEYLADDLDVPAVTDGSTAVSSTPA